MLANAHRRRHVWLRMAAIDHCIDRPIDLNHQQRIDDATQAAPEV
jgi:hypothetical protein